MAARQPDTDLIRTWELAGTAHADRYLLTGGGVGRLAFTCDDPLPEAQRADQRRPDDRPDAPPRCAT